MSVFFSPTTQSLRRNGLSFLLFENEQKRDALSLSLLEKEAHAHSPSTKQVTQKPAYPVSRQSSPSDNRNYSGAQSNTQFGAQSNTQSGVPQRYNQKVDNQSSQTPVTKVLHNTVSDYNHIGSVNASANSTTAHISNTQAPIIQQDQTKRKKNETLTIEEWPNEWRTLYKRFSLPIVENNNAQIRVAWTYAGLEQDVLGPINKQRQAIIRKLTVELNHKQGTHNFIPYSFVHEDGSSQLAMHQNISFFWSAMRLVRPRVLLIFGSVARDSLNMPKTLTPCQKIDMGALQVLQMHKPETLAEDSDHYVRAFSFLQEYLKFCQKR